MEYANHLNEYAPAWSEAQVAEEVARIREAAKRNHNTDVYKMCYSAIDLTTLSCNDSVTSVTEFARKAAEFYQKYPHIPNVASICIYPAFVETVGLAVDGTPMKITSVGGGFPAAQTFLEVKALEVAMAIENGADHIDTAISSFAWGTSHPGTESMVAALKGSEFDTGLDLELLQEIGLYFYAVRKKYHQFESEFTAVDTRVQVNQVPGGMMSNLANQLKEQGALNRINEVFAEIPKVREDLGFPPLVTPTSQIVGTQAFFNVLAGERYKTITNEVKLYLQGEIGRAHV